MTSSIRDKLRSEVLHCSWADLAPHAARAALLLLREDVDLLDAGEALAGDDVDKTRALLRDTGLRRISGADAAELAEENDVRFQFVVVQPWVLAQRLLGPT